MQKSQTKNPPLVISVIGPGSIDFYYENVQKIRKKELNKHLSKMGNILALHNINLIVSPGVGTLLARVYKTFGGGKVLAPAPLEDKKFGIKHLKEHMNEKILGTPLIDGIVNTGDWYQTDFVRILLGDIALILGYAPGSLLELLAGMYMYKLITHKKKGLETLAPEKILREIKAGTRIPFEVWVYKPFVSSKLPREIEEYSKRIGIKIVYLKDWNELDKHLRRIGMTM